MLHFRLTNYYLNEINIGADAASIEEHFAELAVDETDADEGTFLDTRHSGSRYRRNICRFRCSSAKRIQRVIESTNDVVAEEDGVEVDTTHGSQAKDE